MGGPLDWLNYHQLHYFWVIAQEMSVTKAAKRLRLSQSNLSGQLRTLESSLGQPLFERENRRLRLTEAGRLALDYANGIFASGQELVSALRGRPEARRTPVIRVGALNALSKNLQYEFVRPLLAEGGVNLEMVVGDLATLVRELRDHRLDVVISNVPLRFEQTPELRNHRLGALPVVLVGAARYAPLAQNFPASLAGVPLFLPTRAGRFRSDFDAWTERERLKLEVRAEIEDMALLRLFALSGEGVAVVPEIVVRRDLDDGKLRVIKRLRGLSESFFAVTATRRFPNPHVERVVRRFARRLGPR
jgi:LysR family transcriptional activator of nhaA